VEVFLQSPGECLGEACECYISRLLGSRQFYSPSRRGQFGATGRGLADAIWETEDYGYCADVDDAKKWAKNLGINDWFEWRVLSEVEGLVGFA